MYLLQRHYNPSTFRRIIICLCEKLNKQQQSQKWLLWSLTKFIEEFQVLKDHNLEMLFIYKVQFCWHFLSVVGRVEFSSLGVATSLSWRLGTHTVASLVESGCVDVDGSSRELSPLLSFVLGVYSLLKFSSLPCPGDSSSLKIFTCDKFLLYCAPLNDWTVTLLPALDTTLYGCGSNSGVILLRDFCFSKTKSPSLISLVLA